jgi:hypothetical protein
MEIVMYRFVCQNVPLFHHVERGEFPLSRRLRRRLLPRLPFPFSLSNSKLLYRSRQRLFAKNGVVECHDHLRLSGKRFKLAFPVTDENGGKIMAGKIIKTPHDFASHDFARSRILTLPGSAVQVVFNSQIPRPTRRGGAATKGIEPRISG